MYREDLKHMSDVSRKKVDYLLHSPGGYFILSALAGIYLGFGVCLIFNSSLAGRGLKNASRFQ